MRGAKRSPERAAMRPAMAKATIPASSGRIPQSLAPSRFSAAARRAVPKSERRKKR